MLLAAAAHAQTNDLTALLQQGLFEEQASRNFTAAITDYQTLAARFDQDRQIAATAIFRLGECYRAQGRTNEAAAQYQRILHDFSDQPTLATLSRQDLAGMGVANPQPAAEQPAADDSASRLWNQLKTLSVDELEKVLPAVLPDPTLNALLTKRNEANAQRASLLVDHASNNPNVQRVDALLGELNRELHEQIAGMMQGLKLRAAAASSQPDSASQSPAVSLGEDREIARVRQMIQNSPDLINAPSEGITPLVNAAFYGWLDVAQYLLDHGAIINVPCPRLPGGRADLTDLNMQEGSGKPEGSSITPLMAAVTAGNKSMTQFLLNHGANIHCKDNHGDTPLHLAASQGFSAVAEVLLASHADVNAPNESGLTPLFFAAQKDQGKIIQQMLAAGAEVNLKDAEGKTVLNFALGHSPEVVQRLLAAGANPNTEDAKGRTPLSYAAGSGPERVKLLLDAKADPNGGKMDAPLLCAIRNKDAVAAELLLQAGADPNAQGNIDWLFHSIVQPQPHDTPLSLAISSGQLSLVQLLLKFKGDPNRVQDGRPLLFSALDHPEILKAMLDAGADANTLLARSQTTVLMNASGNLNSAAAVDLLLQHGANPDLGDDSGDDALHHAADRLSDEKVFTLLLDHKANPNLRNKYGKTPLNLLRESNDRSWPAGFSGPAAAKNQAQMLIALLHKHGALDILPAWDRITLSRPGNNFSTAIFNDNTNHWNHFTLLEAVYAASLDNTKYSLNFPDLAHIIIVRPSPDGSTTRRITVNLLSTNTPPAAISKANGDNGTTNLDGNQVNANHVNQAEASFMSPEQQVVWLEAQRMQFLQNGNQKLAVSPSDHSAPPRSWSPSLAQMVCSQDVPLEFGDVVEIPEREHSLADAGVYLTEAQSQAILDHFRSLAGEARLVVQGGQTVPLPLQTFNSHIGTMLQQGVARAALSSNSDLSGVKVTRRDPKTNKTETWTVDCSNSQSDPDLRLRAGDVIEVPVKP